MMKSGELRGPLLAIRKVTYNAYVSFSFAKRRRSSPKGQF